MGFQVSTKRKKIFRSYQSAWAAVDAEDISNEEKLCRLEDVWAQVAEEHDIHPGEVAVIANEYEEAHEEYLRGNSMSNVAVICSNCGHGTNAETRRKFDHADDCAWCGCRTMPASGGHMDFEMARPELGWSKDVLDEHMEEHED